MELHSKIEEEFRLTPPQKTALKNLGLKTVEDLLYHFPTRYGDTADFKNIDSLISGESAVVFGKISSLKTSKGFHTKIPMGTGMLSDDTGSIQCVWFNQPYLAKMIADDALVRVEGKVSQRKKGARAGDLYFSNPKIEKIDRIPNNLGQSIFGSNGENLEMRLYPVYPESRGITSNWIFHAIQKIFSARGGSASGGRRLIDTIHEPIPEYILEKYNLPTRKTALIWIHSPHKETDAISARKRFSFEEVFSIQIERQKARMEYRKNPAFVIEKTAKELESFISRFPFKATDAQRKAIDVILNDFKGGHAMTRLLEGDVGSGKTAVAATTAYTVVTTKPKNQTAGTLQVAYMCPTEILATQHFESFIKYFSHLPIQIGLITGSGCRKFPSKVNPDGWTNISRSQLLKWVANGEIAILVGTHALIQKSVKFKHLAYSIIDEQHRFGKSQRQKMVTKDKMAPHLLSMTATPIPRTLALTIYGDLDLTLLDQMPSGRKPVITEIVMPDKRKETYEKIRKELQAGRQAYIICPRIDEPDPSKEMAIIAKSVIAEAEELKKKTFPEYEIGVLHGKLKPKEKDEIMMDFSAQGGSASGGKRRIDILVATSVVEVGVNVPNATVILIEGAERFGLAQLHQLRGRVIRSNHQAYCYVYAETKSTKTLDRLRALSTAKNGFELAEKDLQFRGSGMLSGSKQWGISDIAMEAIKNIKMVEIARNEATDILKQDDTLSKYPELKKHLACREEETIHFE